tara:strand:- start:333 stop:434 length:102 start_codon:yes stop_codon:yes gene_type:complete
MVRTLAETENPEESMDADGTLEEEYRKIWKKLH